MPYYASMIFMLPAIILGIYAQTKVMRAYEKYRKVSTQNGYYGADVARRILDSEGLSNVDVKQTPGTLSDHYDPRTKIVSLSKDVYENSSIASVSVAAHEIGHAIQDKEGYVLLRLRNMIAPIAGFSSRIAWTMVFMGLIFSSVRLVDIAVILYVSVVLFQLFTLPVEINASKRALEKLVSENIIFEEEKPYAKEVLRAAALTYVAASLTAILELLRIMYIRDSERR